MSAKIRRTNTSTKALLEASKHHSAQEDAGTLEWLRVEPATKEALDNVVMVYLIALDQDDDEVVDALVQQVLGTDEYLVNLQTAEPHGSPWDQAFERWLTAADDDPEVDGNTWHYRSVVALVELSMRTTRAMSTSELITKLREYELTNAAAAQQELWDDGQNADDLAEASGRASAFAEVLGWLGNAPVSEPERSLRIQAQLAAWEAEDSADDES